MTRHPALRDDLVERLRSALGVTLSDDGPAEPSPARGPGPGVRARSLARRATRRALQPVLSRVDEVAAARTSDVEANLSARFELLKGEVRAVLATTEAATRAVEEVGALRADLQLLKAELRDLTQRLEHFGMAIAPGAGLVAVPTRMAELRERLDALDRRMRRLDRSDAAPAPHEPAAVPAVTPAAASSGFDYVGFEHRFRGAASTVLEKLTERYADLLASHEPVLDVGCGRGELLAALGERGVAGVGVDLSDEMVDEAKARGVEAHVGDAVEFLAGSDEHAYGSMIAVHVAEHLAIDQLVGFLELAATRLRPGGVLVLETPNPMSLIVLGNSYILDPTHVWPLHPSLLSFLCERAGFRDVRLEFYEPASDYHLPLLEGAPAEPWVGTLNEALGRLNQVLFGPQEYAVIATTPTS